MCKSTPCPQQGDALERFPALRGEALRLATAESQKARPELFARSGARGPQACAEDIGLHLDCLRPTLQGGDLSAFTADCGGLSQGLAGRNVPGDSLPRSQADLSTFFDRRAAKSAGAGSATRRRWPRNTWPRGWRGL